MNNFFLKMWFGAVFSLLTSLLPSWLLREKSMLPVPQAIVAVVPPQRHLKRIVHNPMRAPVTSSPIAPSSMLLLSCQLSGHAPASAEMDVWMTTPRSQEVRHVKTAADGSYQLALRMEAQENEPLDWEILTQTEDSKPVFLSGRRIVRSDELTVSIKNDLDVNAE